MKRILWVVCLALWVSSVQAKEVLFEKLLDQQAYDLAQQWLDQASIHPLQKDLYRLDVYLKQSDIERADELIKQLIWQQHVSPQTLVRQNLELNQLKRNYEWIEKIAYQSGTLDERFVFMSRVMMDKSVSISTEEQKIWLKEGLWSLNTEKELDRVLAAYQHFCISKTCDVYERLSVSFARTLDVEQKIELIGWMRSVEQDQWADVMLRMNLMSKPLKKQSLEVVLKSCELGRDDLCVFKLVAENPLGKTLDWDLLSLWASFDEKTQNGAMKQWITKELNQYIRNVQ